MEALILILFSVTLVPVVGRIAYVAAGRQMVLTPVNVYLVLYVIFHYPLLLQVDTSVVEYGVAVNLGLFFVCCRGVFREP